MARGSFASMIAAATERSRLADANWGRSPEENAAIEKGIRMSPKATAGPSLLRDPIGLKSAPVEKRTPFWLVYDLPNIDISDESFGSSTYGPHPSPAILGKRFDITIIDELATPSLPSHGENWGTW